MFRIVQMPIALMLVAVSAWGDPDPVSMASLRETAALNWPQPGSGAAPEPSELEAPAADRWTFSTFGSALFGDPAKGEQYAAHFGAAYALDDVSALDLQLFAGAVRSGIDDNGMVGGFDLVWRRELSRTPDDAPTVYFEAAAGLQQASTNFSGTRHFNFRLRLGFGATARIDDHVRLILGANYIHISDAGIDGSGGGFDGPMVYAGLTLPF